MKTLFLFFICCLLFSISCTKNKFTTEPQITIKSISPSTVNNGDYIKVKSDFTDKEGDVDTVLVVYKWYNGATITRNDTFRYVFSSTGVPDGTKQAELNVTFTYNKIISGYAYLPGVIKDTTATFGLQLIDKAKHRSNYSESDKIRLIKP